MMIENFMMQKLDARDLLVAYNIPRSTLEIPLMILLNITGKRYHHQKDQEDDTDREEKTQVSSRQWGPW